MKCKFCNAELEEGALICPQCGKELTEQEAQAPAAEEISELEPQEESCPCCAQEEGKDPVLCEEASADDVLQEVGEISEELPDAEASEAAEEPAEEEKAKKNVWKVVLTALCGVLLLGILVVAILYGMGVDLSPRSNDIQYKDSYTVEDAAAVRVADKVVATVNGKELTNGELQAHYYGNMYQFMESYGTYYFSYGEPLDTQVFSEETGMTWQQYFLFASLENWHRYQILCALAEEEGFVADLSELETLPQELETAAVGYGFENADAMIRADMGPACTLEDYIAYIELLQTGNQYVDHKYGQWVPTQEELEAFYTENEADFIASGITKDIGNLADVRHILIIPEGEKTEGAYSEDQWKAALKKAEKVLDEWKKGAATEESFAELANTYSEDPGSNTTGGLYSGIMAGSNYVESFLNWSIDAARKPGDTDIVQTDYGYHIMYYVSGEPVWMVAARENILPELLNDMIEENAERWPMDVKYRNIAVTNANVSE